MSQLTASLRKGWTTVWLNNDYGLYLLGQATSSLGNSIHFIAVMTLVYNATGSTIALSSLWLSFSLPVIFLGPIAGALIDRYLTIRTWMIAADLARAGLVAALAILPFSYISFFPTYLAITIAEILFNAAKPVAMPNLVKTEQLLQANSNLGVAQSAIRLIGPALAGILVGSIGVRAILLIDAATFVASAVSLFMVERERLSMRSAAEESEPEKRVSFVASMAAGLKAIRSIPLLLGIGGFALVRDLFTGGSNIMLLPMVERFFSPVAYGWTMSAFAFGGLVGGLLAGRISNRWMAHTFGVSCLLGGLSQIGFGQATQVGALLLCAGLSTVAVTVQGVVAHTCMQQVTPPNKRGRVFGTLDSAREGAFLLSTTVAGWLGEAIGLRTYFVVDGIVLALGALLLLSPAFIRSFRQPVSASA